MRDQHHDYKSELNRIREDLYGNLYLHNYSHAVELTKRLKTTLDRSIESGYQDHLRLDFDFTRIAELDLTHLSACPLLEISIKNLKYSSRIDLPNLFEISSLSISNCEIKKLPEFIGAAIILKNCIIANSISKVHTALFEIQNIAGDFTKGVSEVKILNSTMDILTIDEQYDKNSIKPLLGSNISITDCQVSMLNVGSYGKRDWTKITLASTIPNRIEVLSAFISRDSEEDGWNKRLTVSGYDIDSLSLPFMFTGSLILRRIERPVLGYTSFLP